MRRSPNTLMLEMAAAKLAPLLPEVVFVGGCATELLITDPGSAHVRPTIDVDIIAEIASYAEYSLFSDRLRDLGFSEDDTQGAPLCRWRHESLVLDVMPLDATILGFSNRWYPDALKTAQSHLLSGGVTIRAAAAPYFLGTKIEAFRGRGNNDYFGSNDLEDLLAVVDGRNSIVEEVQQAAHDLREYIGNEVTNLLSDERFLDALPGFLLPDSSGQARAAILRQRLESLAQ